MKAADTVSLRSNCDIIIYNTNFLYILRYLPMCPPPPKVCASLEDIKKAVDILTVAEKPLVIVGKGKNTKIESPDHIILNN